MEVKRRRVHPGKRRKAVESVKEVEFDAEEKIVEKEFVVDAESGKQKECEVDVKVEEDSCSDAASPDSGINCQAALAKSAPVPGCRCLTSRRTTGPTRRSSKGGWTAEEDELLSRAVKQFGGKNWKKIAEFFPGRTDIQCLHRWQKVLNPDLIKGTWTKEEDGRMIKLVSKFGAKNWSFISSFMPGRMGKQCRERWHNHLKPAIKKDAWTPDEELVLIRAHHIYGNKWVEISKLLPGRTDNSIKNHWNCSLKKRLDSFSPEIHNPLYPDDDSFGISRADEFKSLPRLEDTSPHQNLKTPSEISRDDPTHHEILETTRYQDTLRGIMLLCGKQSSEVDFTSPSTGTSSKLSTEDSSEEISTYSNIKNTCGANGYHQTRSPSMLDPMTVPPSNKVSSILTLNTLGDSGEKMVMDLDRHFDSEEISGSCGPLWYPPIQLSGTCLQLDEDKEFHMPDYLLASFTSLEGIPLNLRSPLWKLRNAAKSFKSFPSIMRKNSQVA